jgi:tetratricopeptide (TPR) repeat protein
LKALSGLAQTYSVMGRTEDAVRLLKQVVASDPRRRDDLLLLGDLTMRSADYAGALEWLGKAERLKPDARSELLMAICYPAPEANGSSNRYLELAKRHAPDNPDVQRSMAGYYRETGNYSAAIAALKSIRSNRNRMLRRARVHLSA